MKPITPEQVKKNFEIPDKAISVINDTISLHFNGIESIFTKNYVYNKLQSIGYNPEIVKSILIKMITIYTTYGWSIQETENGFIFTELLN